MVAYLVAGLLAGFVLQRSRLCFVSGLRDLFLFGATNMTRAVLILLLTSLGGGTVALWWRQEHGLPLAPFLGPAGWPAAVGGGLVFGVGMVLAGSCVATACWRLGEGQLSQTWILLGALSGTWLYQATPFLPGPVAQASMSRWLPAAGLLLALGLLIWWDRRHAGGGEELPPVAGQHRRLRAPWPAEWGAVALAGLLALFLGATGQIWRVTRAFAFAEASSPVFVAGLVLGGLAGARLGRDWRVRSAGLWSHRLLRFTGGLLMGYGARIAYGCTVGILFSGAALGSVLPWIWLAGALPGAWLGTRILRWFMERSLSF